MAYPVHCFYKDNEKDADSLMQIFEKAGAPFESYKPLPEPGSFSDALAAEASLLILPAVQEDCLGVKMAQMARAQNPEHVILLYAPQLPPADYLCLAFREGADDILDLHVDEVALDNQVKRAVRLFRSRRERRNSGTGNEKEWKALRSREEYLERALSRMQERLVCLATSAMRITSGEIDFGKNPPLLFLITGSTRQTLEARGSAEKMGFQVKAFATAEEALEAMERARPQVILTDGTLPDSTAFDLAKKARKTLGNHPVVIVVWSGDLNREDEFLRPGSGLDDFVPKLSGSLGEGLLCAALLGGLR